MKKVLLFTATIIIYNLCLSTVFCEGQWIRNNFADGGNVRNIISDNAGVIYVSTMYSAQVYSSTNGTASWNIITNGISENGVTSFAVKDNVILAGTAGYGIYRSTNQGLNWIHCDSSMANSYVQSFLVKDNYIFAGSDGGICRSSDLGLSWVYVSFDIGSTHGVKTMTAKDNVIFAETFIGASGYMYRSTNNGTNWALVNNGLPNFSMSYLVRSGTNVFASLEADGVYKTTNNGDLWAKITLPVTGTVSVVSLTAKGDTVIASLGYPNRTLCISTNAGNNWYSQITDIEETSLKNIYFYNNIMIGTATYGIYKSTNNGLNWVSVNNGFTDVEIFKIAARNNLVIAGTLNFGVYRSTDYGVNWNLISSLPKRLYYKNIIFQDNKLYISSGGAIMSSSDNGLTFTQSGSTINLGISSFVIKNNYIVATDNIRNVYRSSNSGAVWQNAETGLPGSILTTSPLFIKDTTCFLQINDGFKKVLYYTNNYGLNWDSVQYCPIVENILSMDYNQFNNKLYAGTWTGVFVSSNTGANWIPYNTGLTATSISSFFFNGDTILISSRGKGVFKTTLSSNVWTSLNEGLSNKYVNSITGSQNFLYAGVTANGIFRRSTFIPSSVGNLSTQIPSSYSLGQNYPNPFNPFTKIKFDVTNGFPVRTSGNDKVGGTYVKLVVYDVMGREVQTLVNERLQAGTYEATFDGSSLNSGVYFYRLMTEGFSETKKMLMIK